MCFSTGAGKQARQARADEEARKARIAAGMANIDQTFGKFTPEFYDSRRANYIGYAMPQLERQLTQNRDELVYALSRTGNLDSSAAIRKNADLNYEGDVARIGVENEGQNKANALRSQVENARSNVVSQLNATGDNQAAADAAVRSAVNLETPVGYSPLGNLFASFAQSVANIGSNAANGFRGFAGGGSGGGGGAIIFNPSNRDRIVGYG